MKRTILVVVIMISAGLTFADCPSADLTGDCRVDFNDFAGQIKGPRCIFRLFPSVPSHR